MTREELLEQEIQALKDLVAIKDQIIQALKVKADLAAQLPYVITNVPPHQLPGSGIPQIVPLIVTTPNLPWPGYPNPYVGDLPGAGLTVTYGSNGNVILGGSGAVSTGVNTSVQTPNMCVSSWSVPGCTLTAGGQAALRN